MNAFRFRGATRRLLAGFVAVLAVALCLGVLSTPSWAEEPATSQVKVDASSQVERSVDVVSPDPASGSDTDISRTDVADGATDSAAPEPDASSQQAFIGEAASSEDAGASSQMFPAGSSVTSDPSQVPEYDAAADAEPEGSSAPMGYGSAGDSAANAPVAYSATVYSGDWSYYESKDDSGNTVMDKLAGGELSPYAEAEDRPVAYVAQQPAEAPVAVAGELDGLTYLVVPEGAVDAAGEAYVLDREYAELGGRYVGAGVYVTAYRGEVTDLALPAQIEGADVVSADLSWRGDAEAGIPDPDGRTRLESLSLERGCGLASLDASGSDVAELRLVGDDALGGLPALRFLDLSGTKVPSLDPACIPALERLALRGCPLGSDSLEALSAWLGVTGLPADLEGAGAKDEPSEPEQPAEPANPDQPGESVVPGEPANPDQPSEPAAPAEPEQPSNPVETSEPAVPGEPEQPAEPAIPDQPSEPATPANPDQSEQSAEPE